MHPAVCHILTAGHPPLHLNPTALTAPLRNTQKGTHYPTSKGPWVPLPTCQGTPEQGTQKQGYPVQDQNQAGNLPLDSILTPNAIAIGSIKRQEMKQHPGNKQSCEDCRRTSQHGCNNRSHTEGTSSCHTQLKPLAHRQGPVTASDTLITGLLPTHAVRISLTLSPADRHTRCTAS
jgi:hypothetical protein